MAPTQRKPVYVKEAHHDILRQIAYEQRCTISDVLDSLLENADWQVIATAASQKPQQRSQEKRGKYHVNPSANA